MSYRLFSVLVVTCATLFALADSAAAAPTVADALKLTPVQKGIEYDTPKADEIAKSSIKPEKVNGMTAWVVRGPNNQILRQFADSNGDNVVDVWSYYRDGLEVYRDIDSNNNGKADQYRWFHSAGIRWALDENEDNTIDAWRLISPEEVAEEVVTALAMNDQARFEKLLLTVEDIKSLGLDNVRSEQVTKRLAAAPEKFKTLSADAKNFKFSDFGGTKPGMVPAGSQGVGKDLQAYESVWAMVDTGEEHKQLQLGTLISVKGAWKLIDGPALGTENSVAGFFFDPGGRGIGERATVEADAAPTEKMEKWMTEIQELDQKLSEAAPADKPALNKQRADLMLELANSCSDSSDREQWLKNLADSVSAAAQEGSFPDGIAYLKDLEAKLAAAKESEDLGAYFEFHRMSAEYYGVTLKDPKVDFAKAQEEWLKALEAFVAAHPKSEHAPEALRQMAMSTENAGQIDAAKKWYGKILSDYPNHISASHAKGAINRLTSEGREIALKAKDLSGAEVDLKNLRDKPVVVQYWTTTSDVCKADHAILKDLVSKYGGGNGLQVISINLDYSRDPLEKYLATNRLPWKQVYEEGGFDGRLASEMGVVTVPLILLVGPDGKVISSNIQAAEIESELKKLQVAGLPGGDSKR